MNRLYTWPLIRKDSDRAIASYRRHAYIKRCVKAGLAPFSPDPTRLICGLLACAFSFALFASPIYA